jgi:hypothetical protein
MTTTETVVELCSRCRRRAARDSGERAADVVVARRPALDSRPRVEPDEPGASVLGDRRPADRPGVRRDGDLLVEHLGGVAERGGDACGDAQAALTDRAIAMGFGALTL